MLPSPVSSLTGDFDDDNCQDMEIDLGSDFASDEDMEQEGYGLYTIDLVKNRRIAKFNVNGWEYKLRVPPMNRSISYNQAVQALHEIFEDILHDMLRDVEPNVS